jgi:hypothetical protein
LKIIDVYLKNHFKAQITRLTKISAYFINMLFRHSSLTVINVLKRFTVQKDKKEGIIKNLLRLRNNKFKESLSLSLHTLVTE